MRIEVAVDPGRVLLEAPPQCSLEDWMRFTVMNRLRDAGAPVSGTLMPTLTRGVLARHDDICSNLVRFVWTGDQGNESVRVRPD